MSNRYTYKLIYDDVQERSLRHYAKASRFCFNKALQIARDRENTGKKVSLNILSSKVLNIRKDDDCAWLCHVPEHIIIGAVHDMFLSYLYYKMGNGTKKFPHFKIKDRSRLSFCLSPEDIVVVSDKSIRIEGIDGDIGIDGSLDVCGFKKVRVRFEEGTWVLTCESEV